MSVCYRDELGYKVIEGVTDISFVDGEALITAEDRDLTIRADQLAWIDASKTL